MLGSTLTLLLVMIAASGVVLTGVGGVAAGISKVVVLVTLCLTGPALLRTWKEARADERAWREAESEWDSSADVSA